MSSVANLCNTQTKQKQKKTVKNGVLNIKNTLYIGNNQVY